MMSMPEETSTNSGTRFARWANEDIVSSAVLFAISALSYANIGTDVRNWGLPWLVTISLALIALMLALKGIRGATVSAGNGTVAAFARLSRAHADVFIYVVIAIVWVVLAPQLGFWTTTFLALTASMIYLGGRPTVRTGLISASVAAAVCVGAYLLFRYVFFVPLPDGILVDLGIL